MECRAVTGVLALALLVASAWWPQKAVAQQLCRKWSHDVAWCSVNPGQIADEAWCDGDTVLPLSPEEETIVLARKYADTYQEVCQEWYDWGYPGTTDVLSMVFSPSTPDQVRCFLEVNTMESPANGIEDFGEYGRTFYFEVVNREPCCDANVQGPHSLMPDKWYEQEGAPGTQVTERDPEPGRKFTFKPLDDGMMTYPSQISQIRAPNLIPGSKLGYLSDLYRPKARKLRKYEKFGGVLSGLPWFRWKGYAPQVDHIIPRVDKHGCPCGSNSSKNAQVISARLNRELSNNCEDPRRKAMIKHYTVPSMAAGAVPEWWLLNGPPSYQPQAIPPGTSLLSP